MTTPDGACPPFARRRLSDALRAARALGVGALGGFLFDLAHLPLAWMLGAMVACGLAALVQAPIRSPGAVRPVMTGLVGTALGASFGPQLLDHVADWLVPLAGLVVFLAAASAISYVYFRRTAGLDRPTAFFAAMPGGLVEMVALGAERGGDDRMIALVHAARIFLVVLTLPFLIQLALGVPLRGTIPGAPPFAEFLGVDALWFAAVLASGLMLGRVLRLPAPHLLGPLLVSAAVHFVGASDFALPAAAVAVAQVVIGTVVGCRFLGVPPRRMLRVLALSAGATVLLLMLTLLVSLGVSRVGGEPILPLLLAYSPGGLTEMSLVALSLDIDTAFVIAHHVARVLLVVVGSAAWFSWMERRRT